MPPNSGETSTMPMRCIARTILGLAATTLALACGPDAPPAPLPPTVTVSTPVLRVIEPYNEFTGVVRAIEYAEIRARVAGTLEQMFFEPSHFVEEGDVLFEIEPGPYEASHEEAVANLAASRSDLLKAESDLERMTQAIASRAVSQADLDQAQAARDKAHAAVLRSEAQLKQASIDLGYSRVQTPIAGQVGRNLVDLGNLVGAGEPTLLTTVTRIKPIYVYFNAPESLVLKMVEGDRPFASESDAERAEIGRVHLATAADVDFPHEGQIDFVDNTVDPDTGTIELRAVIPNERGRLFPGLFVRVRGLGGGSREALLVDERAIGTDLGGKFVYTLGEGDVVEQTYVTLGMVEPDGMVVVERGLEGGERYVSNGLLRARPGFPVRPQTEAEAQTAARQAAAAN
jgi:RND family efflux transporter MFP subunit